jgi:sarcosine oxidase subunit beta
MSKALVCSCEDVTLSELDHAIELGHVDLESLKRYTGFGTGMCQGKQCLTAVARRLGERRAPSSKSTFPQPAPLTPFTPRPPLFPTELSMWAKAQWEERSGPVGGVPISVEPLVGAPRTDPLAKSRAKVVVIGGGIMGLALAWNLSEFGETDVIVLEQGYLCAGASGRNGGGVRMQWGTPTLIQLAQRSIALMKRFAHDMGINVWFREGGYLFLAKSDAVVARLEESALVHHRYGVPTQILTPDAALELAPELSVKGIRAAAWNPKDAVIFPWPFMWGYAQQCQKRGVAVETFTRVTGFDLSNGRVSHVVTDRGRIECDRVVISAGAFSPEVAKMLGVDLPNRPYRHEICATEPLKPCLGPLVSVLDTGLYFSQSTRGEIVGGMGDHHEPAAMNQGSSAKFLARYANALVELMPRFSRLRVIRQWAGLYDVTPDNSPILGATPGLSNVLQMNGFVGHGFMMAPAVAERMAKWMISGESDELFERYTLSRFAEGRLEREHMIIG